MFVEKAAEGATGDNVYYLRRLHSTHPSNKHFRRMVALISGELHILIAFSLWLVVF